MATKMTTKTQAMRERLAALLFGAQLLEQGVRRLAEEVGHPLPAGAVVSPGWQPPPRGAPLAERVPFSGGPLAGGDGCALVGCKGKNRTKGYCPRHYQKLRMLEQTGRRPAAWSDYAPVNTVADVVLPRGRAGSKLLAEQRAAQAKKAVRK